MTGPSGSSLDGMKPRRRQNAEASSSTALTKSARTPTSAAAVTQRSLPGHAYANVRQPPISTLNLAHMIPLSAVWAGPLADAHLDAPPLLLAKTEGSTPFRFSLHVGDVGHTLVVGPTGAGKSVLLALMALQFRRYERARMAKLAMGGDWNDLAPGSTRATTPAAPPACAIHWRTAPLDPS